MSRAAAELIKEFEGLKLQSYFCPAGVWTIGYGTTEYENGSPVGPGQIINKERAEALLRFDIVKFTQAINPLIKKDILLTDNQLGAIISFVYNVGPANFKKSTALRLLNQHQLLDFALALLVWNKSRGKFLKGLNNRRLREARIFLTDTTMNSQQKSVVEQALIAADKNPEQYRIWWRGRMARGELLSKLK